MKMSILITRFGINKYTNYTSIKVAIQVSTDNVSGIQAGIRETLGFKLHNTSIKSRFYGANPAKI